MSPRTAAAIAAVKLGRLPGSGACTCGARTHDECSCEWGELIRDLMAMGYFGGPLERAVAIPGLMKRMDQVLSRAHTAAIRSGWESWKGTKVAFGRRLGITAHRVQQILRRSQ